MRKSFSARGVVLLLSGLLVIGLLGGCGSSKQDGSQPAAKSTITVKVGAAAVPHAEILNFIKPKLQQEGINLEVIVPDSEDQLNPALKDKQIDANYFQHIPYLDSVAKEKGYDFVSVAKVHVEPIGFYSQKVKNVADLKDGATIAISNNPSNEYRGLILLEKNGLIKLKPGITQYAGTPRDIVENPKHLKFVEVDPGQLTRALPDVDGAVINTNRILEAKMDAGSALFREEADSPYANVLVVRRGDEERPEIKKIAELLTSPDVKKFIQDKYGVAVVPAF